MQNQDAKIILANMYENMARRVFCEVNKKYKSALFSIKFYNKWYSKRVGKGSSFSWDNGTYIFKNKIFLSAIKYEFPNVYSASFFCSPSILLFYNTNNYLHAL